jgi:hypothetical protein
MVLITIQKRDQIMFKKLATKDNFWNLMFWVGMVSSIFVSEQLHDLSPVLSLICIILSFVTVPGLLINFNKVSFIAPETFINSNGENLQHRFPKHFPIVFVINLLTSGIIISKNFNELSVTSITAIFMTLPTLYFIFKNCPISIITHAKAWKEEVIGWKYDPNAPHTKYNFSSSRNIHERSLSQKIMSRRTLSQIIVGQGQVVIYTTVHVDNLSFFSSLWYLSC